jgi:ABC-2 type transport system permease protein
MKTIIRKTLKQNWKSLFWYSAGLFIYTWIIVGIYPTIEKTAGYETLVQSFPKEMLALFGYDEGFNFSFANYIGGEYLSLMFPLIIGAYIASFATRFFTREIENGQIANILVQPVSRASIYLSRALAFIFSIAIIMAVTFFTMPPLAQAYNYTVDWMPIFKVSIESFIFAIAFGGISFLFSVLVSERGKALALSLGFFISSYIMYALGNINDTIKGYQWLSIFKYYKPVDALNNRTVDISDMFVLLGVFLVTITLGLLWFRRRDISV